MAALILAAYILITRLAEIGFDTIARELGEAEVAWVVVALIIAQSSFVWSGISVRGAVLVPLALLPCVVLQSAIRFINLTVPSSAGRIGMNLRFLQHMGVPRVQAVAAGGSTTCPRRWCSGAPPIVLPFVGASVDTSQFHAPDTRLSWLSPSRSPSAPSRCCGAEIARQGGAGAEERSVRRVERRPGSPQANRAVRRERPVGADVRGRARGDLPGVRPSPEPGSSSSSSTPPRRSCRASSHRPAASARPKRPSRRD